MTNYNIMNFYIQNNSIQKDNELKKLFSIFSKKKNIYK